MSYYFYHEAFDFVNNGEFGFYIEQGNGSFNSVAEEYVIIVHYLGDAITIKMYQYYIIVITKMTLLCPKRALLVRKNKIQVINPLWTQDGGYGVSSNVEGGSTST